MKSHIQKNYTEKELIDDAINQWNKLIVRRKRSLSTRVFNRCKNLGLRSTQFQLDDLKKTPNTLLPFPELDHQQTVESWIDGINLFKEEYYIKD